MSRDTHLRAVLVDIDGTLIDSNDAHARAWMAALKAPQGAMAIFDSPAELLENFAASVLSTRSSRD